jgi:cupin 2 domain-containing protein
MQLKTILNYVERHKSFVYGTPRWFDPKIKTTIDVPIEPRANSKPICSVCEQPCVARLTRDFQPEVCRVTDNVPITNIFACIPSDLPEELVETLLDAKGIRIERIVSHGHASSADLWYDQDQHEWVVLMTGSATVRFKDQDQPEELNPGDFIHIPAHRKHRVEWTTPKEPTVWLAVHYG